MRRGERQLLLARGGFRTATDGGIDIADDVRWLVGGLLVDGLEAAKEEAESVGDDAGAASGDAALGEEDDKVGEDGVDFLDGAEGRSGVAEEIGGEVGGVGIGFFVGGGVFEAQAGGGILDREAAAAGTGPTAAAIDATRCGVRLGACGGGSWRQLRL